MAASSASVECKAFCVSFTLMTRLVAASLERVVRLLASTSAFSSCFFLYSAASSFFSVWLRAHSNVLICLRGAGEEEEQLASESESVTLACEATEPEPELEPRECRESALDRKGLWSYLSLAPLSCDTVSVGDVPEEKCDGVSLVVTADDDDDDDASTTS